MKENKLQIYQVENGGIRLNVDLKKEAIWVNQYQIADIFWVDRSVITKHVNNIYKDWEIDKNSTCAKFAQVQIEGKRNVKRDVEYYNLQFIDEVFEYEKIISQNHLSCQSKLYFKTKKSSKMENLSVYHKWQSRSESNWGCRCWRPVS